MTKVNYILIFDRLLIFILTLIGYCIVGFALLFCFVPILMLCLLPARYRYDNRFLFWLLDKGYKIILFGLLRPIPVTVHQKLPQVPAIYVANHSSSLDIPLVGSLMNGHPHIWYVLEYYSKTPILGFFVRKLGVFVDQASSVRAARGLITGIKLVNGYNRSTIIFPEGGRYNDGTIHPFFEGFAVIAKKTGYPVVPIFLHNVGKVFPPGSFLVYRYPLSVIVGPLFTFLPNDTSDSFTKRIYDWFVEQQKKSNGQP